MSDGVTLTVRSAEKRDAGRGVARISETTRRRLGVLSGDTVVVEGDRMTIVKVWPADRDSPDDVVHIDGDTRTNAGVSVGDTVTVYTRHGTDGELPDAAAVSLAALDDIDEESAAVVESVAPRRLADRIVDDGDRVRVESVGAFRVSGIDPSGPARITGDTRVTVAAETERSVGSGSGTGDAGDEGGEGTSGSSGGAPSGVTYEDIGGLDDELERVREMIELPLREPELFQQLGVDPPRGVLLYGPPGTGKTLIAKAVANEVDATFLDVRGPEIMSKYKGESEEKLRETFEEASEKAPAIVFFDEIDSIAGKRDDGGDVENRVVAQLLSLMDGLEDRGDVIVIGATNRVDSVDPALRRGGRFDREIEIGVPDEAGRREILAVHTRGMPLGEDVSLDRLSERTHGFVGADVDTLTTEASMAALRERPSDREDWDPTVTRTHFESALAAVEPSAMREFVAEAPGASFEDVGGLGEAKQTLRETVQWPLSYDRLFEVTNTDPPNGVLLYGPPGTGKTLLARALAGESEVNFVSVNGPEIIDRYVGESEKAVREVFERARQSAPSIVFFDEIDAIAGQRGAGTHEVTERVVSQLLTELDGLADNPNLVVLAATNRRDTIDDAILRPGRLDTHIEVPEPDEAAREAILEVHTRGKPIEEDVDFADLATDLAGYTGADIDAVIREASMRAIRETAKEHGPEEANERAEEVTITRAHVEAGVAAVDPDRE